MARSAVCLRHSRQVSQTITASRMVRALSPNVGDRTMRLQLVEDEDQQEGDHPGVGPYLVAQQGGHEHDFDDAVDKEVQGGEGDCSAGQAVGISQQVAGDESRWGLRTVHAGSVWTQQC